jgi:hypothetical protein
MNSKIASTVVRSAPYWFAAMTLLGCDHGSPRKSLISKGTAVPSDPFEAEFPSLPSAQEPSPEAGASAGDTAGNSTDDPANDTANETAQQSSGETSPGASSGAGPNSSPVTGDSSNSVDSPSAVSTEVQVGPSIALQQLVLDVACGAKAEGEEPYLCVINECTPPFGVSTSWLLTGDGTYDIDIALAGNVEMLPNVGGAEVAHNDNTSVMATDGPLVGEVNLYELQVGDANYVLNAGEEAGVMFALDGLSFKLKAIPGGTNFVLKMASSDCNQVSTCQMQGNCTADAVPEDGQHIEVTVTYTSS